MSAVTELKHAEEMDSLRRDFKKFWDKQIVPILEMEPLNRKQIVVVELAAWRCFVEGRKV